MGDRSPFRAGFLGVELYYGGAWHDVTADVSADGVTITRGRSPEGGRGDPSSANLSLRNATGTYSPRNPASPLYGLIGRNAPIRIWTEHSVGVRSYRFWGEVVEWPQRWGRTGSQSAYAPIVAAGILRRLGQGASPLRSPLRRALASTGPDLIAYWPMEDGRDAKSFTQAVGTRPMSVSTGGCTPAAYDAFAASEPIPTVGSAMLTATVPSYTASSPNQAQIRWIGRIPAGTPSGAVLVRVAGNGTLGWAEVRHGGPTALQVEAFNDTGASVGAATWAFGQVEDRNLRISLQLTQSGGNISVTLATYEVGADVALFNSGTFTGVTLGSVPRITINPNRVSLGDLSVGHVTFERTITSLFAVSSAALAGYVGETASNRIARLCTEAGVPLTSIGTGGAALDGGRTAGPSQPMGAQGLATLVDLLDEARDVGGGVLYEPRAAAGLALRTLESLQSQTPVTITYQDNLLRPFEPIEDDATTRNKVTVTRNGGASATVEVTDGPLSTQPAPDGVGVYDEALTLSLATDQQAEQHAAWRAHLGTHDEARWPQIGVDLADAPWLASSTARDALLGVDLGDRVDISNLPAWLPPDDVGVLVQGSAETVTPLRHTIVWSCSPARPYRVAYFGQAGDRYSGAGTVLAGTMTTTSTSVTVTPPDGVQWSSADGPFDVRLAGEVVRVGTVSGSGLTQTFSSLTRALNGVVKTHAAGEAVDLADPCYYGL